MKDHHVQTTMTDRRGAVGRVLREAVLVAVVGATFAFAANRISPRGLALTRNYFPVETNSVAQAAVGLNPLRTASGQNPAPPIPGETPAAQMQQKGLQLVNGPQAVQLFHDSHLKHGVIFIDARDDLQYRQGHIPGAYQFDPYRPEAYFHSLLPVCQAAEQIVVYCNGGNCGDSETAALLLKDVGIPNRKIFVYAGGITEWATNHQPVEIGARNSGNLSIAIQ
jgi:rhodanese-related sulfurtransferase